MNSDEYETEDSLFNELCAEYNFSPKLDVFATKENTKCKYFFTLEHDAFTHDWISPEGVVDVWFNPPHNKKLIDGKYKSQTELAVRKAFEQWIKHGMGIMCIIPANAMCTKFAKECIEGKAEYHPIFKRPTFLVNKEKAKDSSRNGYFCVIWRRSNMPVTFI